MCEYEIEVYESTFDMVGHNKLIPEADGTFVEQGARAQRRQNEAATVKLVK